MAGEIEWIVNSMHRTQEIQQQLSRTADPTTRTVLKRRLDEVKVDAKAAFKALKAAAESGDSGALQMLDIFETAVAKDCDDDPSG